MGVGYRVGGSPLVITLPQPRALVAQSEARAENGVLTRGVGTG